MHGKWCTNENRDESHAENFTKPNKTAPMIPTTHGFLNSKIM
jgi:hypothetical protein